MYLIDGQPTGRIKCTVANWTGIAYKLPRTEIDNCDDRDDLKQCGVYFLFGTSDETGEPLVYIGQAGARKNGGGVLGRLQEHKRNSDKDYWSEVVIFTTSNNALGATEISYLENMFCKLAHTANRYIVKNANEPTQGNITEEKRDELDDFIDYVRIVVGTFGHNVFEPVVACGDSSESDTPTVKKDILYMTTSKVNAKGVVIDEGFVVLKGSVLSSQPVTSCSASIRGLRQSYAHKVDNNVLQEDILFTSPSAAASYVAYNSSNGRIAWKTKDGITLKELENL